MKNDGDRDFSGSEPDQFEFVPSRVTLERANGARVVRALLLTPRAAREITDTVLGDGDVTALGVILPADASTATFDWVIQQFSWLGRFRIAVDVRRQPTEATEADCHVESWPSASLASGDAHPVEPEPRPTKWHRSC